MFKVRVLALLVFSLSMAACGSSADTVGADESRGATGVDAASQFEIRILPTNMGVGAAAWGPNPMNVPIGQTVTWVNVDYVNHQVYVERRATDEASMAEPVTAKSNNMLAGATFSHRFDQPGTYSVYCLVHGNGYESSEIIVK